MLIAWSEDESGLMQGRIPTSRGRFQVRLSLFDSLWAIAAPVIALYFRDALILSHDGLTPVLLYFALSVIFSLLAFSAFRIHDGMSRYFSVHDAIAVTKAVIVAALLTYIALFTITRLDGIPRSLPFIHALVLGAGLVLARTFARLSETDRRIASPNEDSRVEHIVMLGSTRLTALYIKFLDEYSSDQHRVMAILDDRPHMIGRAIEGRQVVGPIDHLLPIIREFAQHGVPVDRVIASGETELFSGDQLAQLRLLCAEHEIRFDTIPQLMGLANPIAYEQQRVDEVAKPKQLTRDIHIPEYFRLKRFLDFGIATAAVLIVSPLWLVASVIALIDVGSPILFWQQRLGQGGRTFLLHKIRTLRPPYDSKGVRVPDEQRLSWMGKLLRNLRLDEFPQILNVLVGDMSIIGPRPLLPHDQPANPKIRLMVRPGITGWAQVNGGTLLNADDKDALDEWYIRNASLWLDLRIIYMTVAFWFRGQQRGEEAIAMAKAVRGNHGRLTETNEIRGQAAQLGR